ncbi:hypothetical protein B0H13DRAFT_2305080 [Mycena leptocephala]|nr:hypothetical protein B0H13DRAFT_2305080 [Mycena leptocephala]
MTDTPTYSDDRKVLLTDKSGSYDPWEFRMRPDARSKSLLDTITGDDLEPTTGHNSKSWKAWKARQNAAASLLIKGLDDGQIVHVRGLEDDPHAMWEKWRKSHIQNLQTKRLAPLEMTDAFQQLDNARG